MRFQFPRLTPTVKKLLIFLGVSFVTVAIVENVGGFPLFELGALNVGFMEGNAWMLAWQPFTYWMVWPPQPAALIGFAITLLMIYFFLSAFEESFGAKRTLQLTGVGVLAGAAGCLALGALLSVMGVSVQVFPPSGAGVVAAAAFGAFPVIFRGREILLFPLMIPLKAWTALAIGIGISALMAVLAKDPFVLAEQAAAIAAGVGFAKWITRPRTPSGASPKKKKRRSGPDLRVVRGGDDEPPRYLN
ncbi:MAG: hypothetical protein SangKO_024350 [Sandaracinaceae bacterium]|nr:MAG: hypothetical protein EVA89_14975 [Sandaracinaceae bacterium]